MSRRADVLKARLFALAQAAAAPSYKFYATQSDSGHDEFQFMGEGSLEKGARIADQMEMDPHQSYEGSDLVAADENGLIRFLYTDEWVDFSDDSNDDSLNGQFTIPPRMRR